MKALTWERLLIAATKTEQQDSECVCFYTGVLEKIVWVWAALGKNFLPVPLRSQQIVWHTGHAQYMSMEWISK